MLQLKTGEVSFKPSKNGKQWTKMKTCRVVRSLFTATVQMTSGIPEKSETKSKLGKILH